MRLPTLKTGRIFFIIATLATLTSCQNFWIKNPQKYTQPAQYKEKQHIKIEVTGEPELTQTHDITDTKTIMLPYIGSIDTTEKTAKSLEQEITTRLQDGYILNPHVSVQFIKEENIYILGHVRNPGKYNIPPDAAIIADIIALAGGYAANANKKSVELVRKENGHTKHYQNAHILSPIKSGDTIIVNGGGFWL